MRQLSFPWGEDTFVCARCGEEAVGDEGVFCAACEQERVDEMREALADALRREPQEPPEISGKGWALWRE